MNDDKFYSFFKPRIIQLLNLREKNYEENFEKISITSQTRIFAYAK